MESIEQLRPVFTGLSDEALTRLAGLRHRARTDHFFLGNKLVGFDFYEDVHRGLFDAMLQKDPSKPIHEQGEIRRRLILWARGHYKTSAEVVEIIQLILCFPNITIL